MTSQNIEDLIIKIRKAKQKDLQFIEKLARKAPEVMGPEGIGMTVSDFKYIISKKSNLVVVALVDSERAGFAMGKIGYPTKTDAELYYIYVKKKYAGKGVGFAMLSKIEKMLKRQGIEYLYTEAPAGNKRAMKFYKKMGFSEGCRYIELEKALKGRKKR